jgi:hypothetical protein
MPRRLLGQIAEIAILRLRLFSHASRFGSILFRITHPVANYT